MIENNKKNKKPLLCDINNDKVEKLKKYIDIKEISTFPKKNVNKKK